MKSNELNPSGEIEATQPRIFHIHIDAQYMSKEFYEQVTQELKFYDSDFGGHPEGYSHFEPQRHLTLKVFNKEDFEAKWKRLVDLADLADFKGYLEGEYIPFDDFIPYKEYKDIPIPFSIKRRKLSGKEGFRQTEIHLTFDKDKSNPDLIKKLLDAGLFGAYIPKKHGTFLVLTAQGRVREISKLWPVLKSYIEKSGGTFRCTLKEERAIKYKVYGVTSVDMPEVIESVSYLQG